MRKTLKSLLTSTAVLACAIPAANAQVVKPLGSVSVTKSDYLCAKRKPERCYDLTVSCPGVSTSIGAILYVRNVANGTNNLGTITFHSGAKGTTQWSGSSTDALNALASLNTMGYQTVEVKWKADWTQGGALQEGMPALACRTATVMNWVYNNLRDPSKPMCSTGNSGGGVQVSYALTDYGFDTKLSGAVITSAPGVGDLVSGCMTDSTNPLYLIGQTNIVDRSYGTSGNTGVCTLRNASFTSKFSADSISLGTTRDYYYPNTKIYLYYGENDTTTATIAQSELYYDRLVQDMSPLVVAPEIIPGVDHSIPSWAAGVNKIKTALIDACVYHGT